MNRTEFEELEMQVQQSGLSLKHNVNIQVHKTIATVTMNPIVTVAIHYIDI